MNPYTLWPYVALLIGTFFLAKAVLGPWPASRAGLGFDQKPGPHNWRQRTRDVSWYMHIMLPLYMIHQFEEHGIDLLGRRYAFQPIICNRLMGRPTIQGCPATDLVMFFVNIAIVWAWGLQGRFGDPSGPGANFLGFSFVNFLSHLESSVREGFTYNPGFLTAWVFFVPVAYFGFKAMLDRGVLTWRGVVRGLVVGFVEHAIMAALFVWLRDGIVSEGFVCFSHSASNLFTFLATRPV